MWTLISLVLAFSGGYVTRMYFTPKQLKDAGNKVIKDIKNDLK